MSAQEAYCRWLGNYFFIPGMDSEDIAQEARIAMLGSPYPRRAARLRVLDLLKMAKRRPQFALLTEDHAERIDLEAHLDARAQLQRVVTILAPQERVAVGRVIRGEPIRRDEKPLQAALHRARQRLAA